MLTGSFFLGHAKMKVDLAFKWGRGIYLTDWCLSR